VVTVPPQGSRLRSRRGGSTAARGGRPDSGGVPGGPPLLALATGPYASESFDCPALDTLFLAAPVASRGSLTQYVGRILHSHENKTTAEVHDHLDERTGVLAAMLARLAPGYTGLGFPGPRKLALTPSASAGR
jgi:hypothetical protein